MKKNKKWPIFILLLFFFIGLLVMFYPALSNYWNQRVQSMAIVDYEKMMENMPKEDFAEYFDAAEKYNKELKELNFPLLEYRKIGGYLESLDPIGTGMIGYINIDKIGVHLPIYHTTEERVLSVAVGHVEGSTLPIGGKGTHALLSAHRGLPSATLFTNLDHVDIGDTFTVTVLDRVLTYQVDNIEIVEPGDTEFLTIDNSKDMCTLITCTPYGINTHRLLVRGQRIETVVEKVITVTSEAYRIDVLIVTPIVALPMLTVLMLVVLLKPANKKKTKKSGDGL